MHLFCLLGRFGAGRRSFALSSRGKLTGRLQRTDWEDFQIFAGTKCAQRFVRGGCCLFSLRKTWWESLGGGMGRMEPCSNSWRSFSRWHHRIILMGGNSLEVSAHPDSFHATRREVSSPASAWLFAMQKTSESQKFLWSSLKKSCCIIILWETFSLFFRSPSNIFFWKVLKK